MFEMYEKNRLVQIFLIVIFFVAALPFVGFLLFISRTDNLRNFNIHEARILIVLGSLFLGIAILLMKKINAVCITFYVDHIIYKGLFSTRKLSIKDIKGYVEHNNSFYIYPKNEAQSAMHIPNIFEDVHHIESWLETNSAVFDVDFSEDEIKKYSASSFLSQSGEFKYKFLDTLRKFSKPLYILSWGLYFATSIIWLDFLFLRVLAILICVSLIAIVILSKHNFTLVPFKLGKYLPNLFYSFGGCACAIYFGSKLHLQTDFTFLAILYGMILSIFLIILLHADFNNMLESIHRSKLNLVLSVLALYLFSYGFILHVNRYFDFSEGKKINVEYRGYKTSLNVKSKYVNRYMIKINHPEISTNYLYVNRDEFMFTLFKKSSGELPLKQHRGLFHIPWYSIEIDSTFEKLKDNMLLSTSF